MHIRQIQVSHDAPEDRLLMKIATLDNEEILVAITRRFLRQLWLPLMNLLRPYLASTPLYTDSLTASSQGEIWQKRPAESRIGQSFDAASFDHPYCNEAATYPFGTTPLLVVKAKLVSSTTGASQLILTDAEEHNISVHTDPDLLHGLCAMLRSVSDKADWKLHLDYSTEGDMPNTEPPRRVPERRSRMLH